LSHIEGEEHDKTRLKLSTINSGVQDLLDARFARASTTHSLLWYVKHASDHPKAAIGRNTLLVGAELPVGAGVARRT